MKFASIFFFFHWNFCIHHCRWMPTTLLLLFIIYQKKWITPPNCSSIRYVSSIILFFPLHNQIDSIKHRKIWQIDWLIEFLSIFFVQTSWTNICRKKKKIINACLWNETNKEKKRIVIDKLTWWWLTFHHHHQHLIDWLIEMFYISAQKKNEPTKKELNFVYRSRYDSPFFLWMNEFHF